MKRLISLLALGSCVLFLQAQPADLFVQGNEAYKRADYQQAIEAYTAVLDAGYENADLYYNLGNAYYRSEQMGMAILNYERALRLQPNFREARQNLQLANARTEDKITPLPEFLLAKWYRSLLSLFSPGGWYVVLFIFFALLAALGILFYVASSYRVRKAALVGGLLTAVVGLLVAACCISSTVRFNRHDRAVVTQPLVVVKGSPDMSGIEKLVLHDGATVFIDETLDEWHKIHLADGNTGWLHSGEITVI